MNLQQLIEEENYQDLYKYEKCIAKHVEYEIQKEDIDVKDYLIYKISRCQNITHGIIMFQILKKSCEKYSQCTWIEIMKVLGKPMMFGSVQSQNIKLLEHVMAHVDEIYLERLLYDVDAPEVSKWYDENFT